jgi:hypothetical protein
MHSDGSTSAFMFLPIYPECKQTKEPRAGEYGGQDSSFKHHVCFSVTPD